ncbi:MAG: dihydropteroate synthase [Candidatus Omnitrophica bacterium]|nr:dihydropteroate synthase [Candidatus Omnitrophota bacterium]
MRVIEVRSPEELKTMLRDLKVDPYGVEVMSPKGISHLVRINAVSCIAANILKQEMLSLGGDAALPRDVLTGGFKSTGCILMGNLSQFNRLQEKLNRQPFNLNRLGKELAVVLANYRRGAFLIDAAGYKLDLSRRTCVMGILNLTPDSFSGDGMYRLAGSGKEVIRAHAEDMVAGGARILDVGGESSRPGAKPVSVKEEVSRTIPVIQYLVKKIKVPVSVDTCKPEVARRALDNGAFMINDISGLRDDAMLKVVSRFQAAVIIMHMKGRPRTMQRNPVYKSLIDDIIGYLKAAIARAEEAGIAAGKIVVDPGIGFGKTLGHNLEILRRLREFKVLGKPILAGPSRKAFIGKLLNVEPPQRVSGTISACVLASANGANIVRVHDVKEVAEALTVSDAILSGSVTDC